VITTENMGTTCAIERNLKPAVAQSSYVFSLTCIPAYDKFYRDCQKLADNYEESKVRFETARFELVSIVGEEMITYQVYADAIELLVKKHAERYELSPDSIKITEKFPYLQLGPRSGPLLVKDLQVAIRFIMLLEQTRKELLRLEASLQYEKNISRYFIEQYEEKAIQAGLEGFDKVLGREIAKKNGSLMLNLHLEVKSYYNELETIVKLLPKHLEKLKENIKEKSPICKVDLEKLPEAQEPQPIEIH